MPLVYAIKGAQSGHLMHNYKTRATTPAGTKQLELLCRLGFGFHERCIRQVVGEPVTAWAVAPSTHTPATRHLLHTVVLPTTRTLKPHGGAVGTEITLVPGPEFRRTPREWLPRMWKVGSGTDPARHHVLLLDDTWTTGGNAQSAATALREAGASAVTILTLARWLDRNRDSVPEFIARHLAHRDLDLLHCPASSAGCPTPF
ncbi:hypothetical protein BJ969_005575 [Saccharopolyspora gloriosae]|uniref:Phosphoribosyltransferase domain-containing protein n=1 Tax=Saccharopolyspora gloriosae TaxID=455344 RepID=A0A840NWK1_9PSEU|nr:hypothetical protein [Saccharopolyspora gloriosae]MBB5072487.1 hypothetical protein [Saccharopolyspora gloriosae]